MKMENKLLSLDTPLFEGITQQDRRPMLDCITYHTAVFSKGEIIAFEQENMKHIGIVLSGAVDMIKEDLWGNKTLLVRMRKNELFGETFACGNDSRSTVTFQVSEDAEILFLPFDRVMRSCNMACVFHHRLIENIRKGGAGGISLRGPKRPDKRAGENEKRRPDRLRPELLPDLIRRA